MSVRRGAYHAGGPLPTVSLTREQQNAERSCRWQDRTVAMVNSSAWLPGGPPG